MKCNKCGGFRSFCEKNRGIIVKCRDCGFISKFEQPSYENYQHINYSKTRIRTLSNDPLLREIRKNFPIQETDKVLDYGCGNGDYSNYCRQITKSVIGVDIDVSLASLRYPNISFRKQKKTTLMFGNHTFDKIVCINTIEHVWDAEKLLKEFKRILKPKGCLLITTLDTDFFLHQYSFDYTHIFEWNLETFRLLISKYFKVELSKNYGALFNYYPYNLVLSKIIKPDLLIIAKNGIL